MKKILMICLLCFSTCVISQAKGGTYYNTNPNTNDIKRVRITKNSQTGQQFIRIYAACGKGECYWGRFKINRFPDLSERIRRLGINYTWLPYYSPVIIDKSFVRRNVAISNNIKNKDHIQVIIYSDYKDPNRKDLNTRNILKLK